jgi:hypothetical protein
MTAKLMTLETWAAEVYGSDAPCMNTLRAWARQSKIFPAPVKHGRAYYVTPDARYTPFARDPGARSLVRRIHGSGKAQRA